MTNTCTKLIGMGFVFFFSCFSRAKCFRGKKVLGDYDIKVEQVTTLEPRIASAPSWGPLDTLE